MKKLIQIRGGHASGKTETVRQFLKNHPQEERKIDIIGKTVEATFLDDGIIVLGKYEETGCGGCDGRIKRTIEMIDMIRKLSDDARIIVFEQMVLARRYKSTKEIIEAVKPLGFTYHGILIERDLSERTRLMRERNGGKQINLTNFVQSAKDARNSSIRLFQDGYRVDFINVTGKSKKEMGEIIEQRL